MRSGAIPAKEGYLTVSEMEKRLAFAIMLGVSIGFTNIIGCAVVAYHVGKIERFLNHGEMMP